MYDSLPPQLAGAAVEAIRTNLRAATLLHDEVKALKPYQRQQLPAYVAQAYDRVTAVNHGERDRFYVPHAVAAMQIGNLHSERDSTISEQFSKHKTALVSALNQYCKGLQRGLQEHDKEAGTAPVD